MNAAMKPALLVALFVGSANAECPSNFFMSISTPGKCYYVSTSSSDFFSSVNYCRNLTHGADIVAIANGFENNEVATILSQSGVAGAWIGSAFYDNKTHWITTAAGNSTYSNWPSGTYNGDAAFIVPSGSWGVNSVSVGYYFICQLYPDDPTTFPPPQISCSSGWTPSISAHGKCYYIGGRGYYFFDTVNYCRNLIHGADIVAIANEFENYEVATLMSSRGATYPWIGNAFYDNKAHWITTAASSSNYSNLPSGTYNGYFVYIEGGGVWYPTTTNYGNYIFCQIYPDDPTTFPPPQITCPSGWTPSISVRGKCYRQINVTNFYAAIRNCETTEVGDSHAELVTLTSQLEMMELWEMSAQEDLWVSMTNLEGDGAWHWVDTLHPTDYFGPNGSPFNGSCAYTTNTNLYGTSSSANATTICQYFPDEPSTSTLATASTIPNLDCPQNGIGSLAEPRTCYYVLNGTEGFQSARNACHALDTGFDYNDLFVPRSDAEYYDFESRVVSQALYPLVWLGLINSNGSWGWISNRTSNVTDFWCNGQPDNAQYPDHQCGFVVSANRYNGHICWIAGDCTAECAAVCQSSDTL